MNDDVKKFAKELEVRTKDFAVRIIKISQRIPTTPEGRVLRNQLTKSGTSIGANYREANRARSKADFRNKIRICESEASETQYWLEILIESDLMKHEMIEHEIRECAELLALFTSITRP
jgi:four helix bundle protein